MKTKRKCNFRTRVARGLKTSRKKHPCPDCRICQHCPEARCAVCRA